MNRRLAAATLAAVAVFGLASCTAGEGGSSSGSEPGPGPGGSAASDTQTVEQACAAVTETIQAASGEFDGISADDPAGAAAAFQSAADAVGEAADEVGNAEVAAILPDIETVFAAAADAMTAMAEGDESQVAEMQNLGADLQDSFAKFQELCLE